MQKNKRLALGFTLVELLVVIAIITLLAGMLLPALKKARDTTKKMACASNMRQLGLAIANYPNDNNGFMPMASNDITNITWDDVIRGYLGKELTTAQMMSTMAPLDWPSNKLFACPADNLPRASYAPEKNKRSYTANSCWQGPDLGPGKSYLHGPIGRDLASSGSLWVKTSMIEDFSGTFLLMEKPLSWVSLGYVPHAGEIRLQWLMREEGGNIKPEGFHEGFKYNFLHVDGHVTTQNPFLTTGPTGTEMNPCGQWTRGKGD